MSLATTFAWVKCDVDKFSCEVCSSLLDYCRVFGVFFLSRLLCIYKISIFHGIECRPNRWVHIKFSTAVVRINEEKKSSATFIFFVHLIYCYCIECKKLLKKHVFLVFPFFPILSLSLWAGRWP